MKKRVLAIILTGAMTMQIFGSAVFASADVPEIPADAGSDETEDDLNALDAGGLLIGDITEELILADEEEFGPAEDDLYVGYEDDEEAVDEISVDFDGEEAVDADVIDEAGSDEPDAEVPEEAGEAEDAAAEKGDDAKESSETVKKDDALPEVTLTEEEKEALADAQELYPEVPVYYAEDVEDAIENAESLRNEAFFEIDPEAGEVNGGDILFEELSDGESLDEVVDPADTEEEKAQKIEDALEETGLYEVEKADDGNLEVTSLFAFGRIMLEADYQENIQSYGATNAIYYDGSYEFTYDSEEAAKNAYDLLVAEYGEEAVIPDTPVKVEAARGWGASHMNLDIRMRQSSANYAVKVAVVDTGVNSYHEVFDNTTIVNGYCIPEKNYDYYDVNGHGTAVAGQIAESTGSNVKIMPIRVATDSSGSASSLDILKGAQYASGKGAKVINISMGGPETQYQYDYYSKRYAKINRVIVCASGNDDHNMNYYLDAPAVYPSTIAVGAIDSSGYVTDFSNYGSSLDYVAPGKDILCASRYGGWEYMSGTSMSSPYIAAAVALLYGDNKNLTVAEVRKVLKEMSVDLGSEGKDSLYGWGEPRFSSGSRNIRGAKVNNISNRVYSGKLIKPCPRVTYNGVKLTRGVDYTLNWSNNKLAGKGIVLVVGKGRYTGVTRKAFNIILKGRYTVRSAVNTGYTLDIKGGSRANNANVQLYKLNNSAAQKFTITKVGNYYKLINVKSGKALEVKGGVAKNGRNVQQYKWNKSKAQLWKVKMYAGGKIMFVSAVNGKYCLDLAGAKAKNGANVQLYKRNNSKAQRWYVKRAK